MKKYWFFIAAALVLFAGYAVTHRAAPPVYSVAVYGAQGEEYSGSIVFVKADKSTAQKSVAGKFENNQPIFIAYNEQCRLVSATIIKKTRSPEEVRVYLLDKDEKILQSASTAVPFGQVTVASK